MRVFDCFTFYNEFDLLEIRLRELYDHIDVFVLVEADHTFTNNPKPYLFEQYLERYRPWLDKIRYIKHTSLKNNNPWYNADDQRNAMLAGITDADDNDLIVVSDVDEIMRSSSVDYIRIQTGPVFFGFRMPLFNFKFNYMRVYPDPGPYDVWATAAPASWVRANTAQGLRNLRSTLVHLPNAELLTHAGWHFSYLGDEEWLRDKARSTVHQEENTPELLTNMNIAASIANKKSWDRTTEFRYDIVDMTDYFPKACFDYPNHQLANAGVDPLVLLQKFQ
jgi:Glycosyltransferase family 17